ncbi:MAG: TVP38/TMEM64 family protein [Bacteroidia bacterium]
MKRYIYISLVLITFFLITFSAVEYFNVPLLKDPSYLGQKGGLIAAIGGFLLLVSDIVLPVPGSLIMIGNGALFGVYLGTLFSVAGGMAMSAVGFLIGKKGVRFINRFISDKEQETGKKLMEQWGYLAILVTRPVPLLSETVIIIAGSTGLKFRKVMLASLLGYLPGAYIYALAGASAISEDNAAYSFLIVIGVAALFWFTGKFISKRTA